MQRFTSSGLKTAARGIHTLVFVEDHSIITGNKHRVENLRQALKKVEPKLKEDTCTLVKLNSGYYRPNEVVEFQKGAFDIEQAMDLKGNHGPSGIWGNISRVVKGRSDGDVNMLVLTNAADDASRHPLCTMQGLEELVKTISDGRAGLRFSTWAVGLDVTREHERKSMGAACNWTGGDALFLDCDGQDADGTTVTSAPAEKFFAAFNEKSSNMKQVFAANKKTFNSNIDRHSVLSDLVHTPPAL